MISIVKFWNALNERAVTGTSGYDDSFISKVNQSQMQLMTTLLPFYENNQAVKDILDFFLTPDTKSTNGTNGILNKPDDYMYFCSVKSINTIYAAFPINNNEVSIINSSPIRKPNVGKGNIFYFQKNNQIYFLPKDVVLNVEYDYIRRFKDAALTLNPVSTPEIDYLQPSSTGVVDLEWPEQVFDLLLYITIEKLGMEMKEPILIEYANLGLSREMVNVDPQ